MKKYSLLLTALLGGLLSLNTVTVFALELQGGTVDPDGKTVWYLGGKIAEDGVALDSDTQCQHARAELKSLFPWIDTSNWQFDSFLIDRAEAAQPKGKRPDNATTFNQNNISLAWPTKLAFAPCIANEIEKTLATIQPRAATDKIDWPTPEFAKPPWDEKT